MLWLLYLKLSILAGGHIADHDEPKLRGWSRAKFHIFCMVLWPIALINWVVNLTWPVRKDD